MKQSSRKAGRSDPPALPMSDPEPLLLKILTDISFKAIGRGKTEELQEKLKQGLIQWLLLKEEQNETDTVFATQEPLLAFKEEFSAAQPVQLINRSRTLS